VGTRTTRVMPPVLRDKDTRTLGRVRTAKHCLGLREPGLGRSALAGQLVKKSVRPLSDGNLADTDDRYLAPESLLRKSPMSFPCEVQNLLTSLEASSGAASRGEHIA
jgi:hypothetical protein